MTEEKKMSPQVARQMLTRDLVEEIINKWKPKKYMLTPRDIVFFTYLFNKYKITTLKDKEKLEKAIEDYDKHDYLALFDTGWEVFYDLKFLPHPDRPQKKSAKK